MLNLVVLKIRNWSIFIKERFPLKEHLPFLIIFYLACYLLGVKENINIGFKSQNFTNLLISFLTILLIFFHLRLFDEIKDYDKDKIIHPNRPLVRGLITLSEAKKTVAFIIIIEILLSLFLGLKTLMFLTLVIVYSFLMYKEFFIKEWLRKKIVLYAFTHAIIMPLITLYIYFCNFKDLSTFYFIFSIANWFVSNLFEFSRKMLLPKEEGFQDSYISQIGYTKTISIHYIIMFFLISFLLIALSKKFYLLICFILVIVLSIIILKLLSKKEISIKKHKNSYVQSIKFSKHLGYIIIIGFYLFLILYSVIDFIKIDFTK
jgi:4-hydroxybenzoate polyprenyltransferase